MITRRAAHRIAWSSAALSVVLVTTGLALGLLAWATEGRIQSVSHQFFLPVVTLTFSTVGALIAGRHPANPIGWMLIATGCLSALELLALGYSLYSLAVTPDPLPGTGIATWLESWLWIFLSVIPMTFLILLFPDGRLLSPRWRPVAWIAGLALGASGLGLALDAGPLLSAPARPSPSGSGSDGSGVAILINGGYVLLTAAVVASVVSLIVRYRRSGRTEREQLRWLAYGLGVTIPLGAMVMGLAGVLRPGDPVAASEAGTFTTGVMALGIILAVGIAIIRNHLYDIDLLINRTLVYGVLTGLIAASYVLVVGGLGAVFQSRGSLPISLFAAGVVAVWFQPMRERLQRVVNRMMYGDRDDPYAVLSSLGERLEGALAPGAALATLVETVAQSLKLPYAAIALQQGESATIAATYGRPAATPEQFPLMLQGEIVGQLIVAPRATGEPFRPAERHLLASIGRQAGAAVHAARLTADLQASRVRLVTTREEERRRLRRDLHDGLGPILASQGLKLAAARHMLPGDPASVEALLDQVIAQNESSVAEIRRLVYGLRPPALDERGLVEAIRDHVAGLDGRGTAPGGLHVEVKSVPADLPSLPAAVEVAAYRIALEALTNVLRHAHAQHCAIRFTLESRELGTLLRVEVNDDGVGLPSSVRVGVGLRSMRERAEELGGTLTHGSFQGGGTRVVAELPTHGVS